MAEFINKISSIKILVLLFSCIITVLFSGCNTPTVNEYGNIYQALTKKEERLLLSLARATLKHNVSKGVVSAAESDHAAKNEPEFRIRYFGDRFGEARLSWQMPTRRIMVVFDGNFLTPEMHCILQIADRRPEMLDYSTPSKKPQLMDFYHKKQK